MERLEIPIPYRNTVNAVYSNPIPNINLNREKLKAVPLKLIINHGSLLFLYLFNIALDFLAKALGHQKENKGIQIGKEKVRPVFCR